jgi:hypothetical protein
MTALSGGMKLRRRSILPVALAALAIGVALAIVPVTAAASGRLAGTFSIQFPKGHPASNAPCSPDDFCGVGTLQGYGKATLAIVDETFTEILDSDCLAVTRTEAIQPIGSTDVLVLDENGTFCRPGASGGSHAGQNSYGSPGVWSFSFTVNGADGEGVFSGATGRGSVSFETAGGIGVWTVRGTLSLA